MTTETLPAVAAMPADLAVPRILPPNGNPFRCYVLSLPAKNSRDAMTSSLNVIARMAGAGDPAVFPWERLRRAECLLIRAALIERYSTASAARHAAALKGVLKEAWRMELLPHEDYCRAVDWKMPTITHRTRDRVVSGEEITEMLKVLFRRDGSSLPGIKPTLPQASARNAAMLAVSVGAGLRCAEMLDLRIEDWTPSKPGETHPVDVLTIRHGKGDKIRTEWVAGTYRDLLRNWLRIRGDAPGALFTPCEPRHNGTYTDRDIPGEMPKLSPEMWTNVINLLAREAGIPPFQPHDLRRTCATELLLQGADIRSVQTVLGHSSVVTTQRYDLRAQQGARAAVAARPGPEVPAGFFDVL